MFMSHKKINPIIMTRSIWLQNSSCALQRTEATDQLCSVDGKELLFPITLLPIIIDGITYTHNFNSATLKSNNNSFSLCNKNKPLHLTMLVIATKRTEILLKPSDYQHQMIQDKISRKPKQQLVISGQRMLLKQRFSSHFLYSPY